MKYNRRSVTVKTSMKSKTHMTVGLLCTVCRGFHHACVRTTKNFSVCKQPPVYKLRGRHFGVILPETTYKCGYWWPSQQDLQERTGLGCHGAGAPADSVGGGGGGGRKRGRKSRMAEANKVILVPKTLMQFNSLFTNICSQCALKSFQLV